MRPKTDEVQTNFDHPLPLIKVTKYTATCYEEVETGTFLEM